SLGARNPWRCRSPTSKVGASRVSRQIAAGQRLGEHWISGGRRAMALQSMTGFARAEGGNAVRWAWELRSVNGKGLDVRIRAPNGFERLESAIREQVAARFTRGNIQALLSVEGESAKQRVVVNEAVLSQVLAGM